MAKVIALSKFKQTKLAHVQASAYATRIQVMDKLALLEEMVRFQETRSKLGKLTPEMMVNGKILFKALEERAETRELRLLTRAYCKHLDSELDAYLKNTIA